MKHFNRFPRIIGITGRAYSGKDTAAKVLDRVMGYSIYHWADPIKKLAYTLNPPIHNSCIKDFVDELGWDEAKKIPAVREYLQFLGTEGVRECIHPDTWVWAGTKHMEINLWVVPDCRFRNEADWVKQNGVLLLIKRPGVGSVNNHVSDAGLIDRFADITIENDGTVEELELKVLNLSSGL